MLCHWVFVLVKTLYLTYSVISWLIVNQYPSQKHLSYQVSKLLIEGGSPDTWTSKGLVLLFKSSRMPSSFLVSCWFGLSKTKTVELMLSDYGSSTVFIMSVFWGFLFGCCWMYQNKTSPGKNIKGPKINVLFQISSTPAKERPSLTNVW